MIKKANLILVLLLLFNSVSAASLGISPSSFEITGKANEKICNKITLFASFNNTLIGDSKWAKNKNNEKDIRKYILSPESINLDLEYPQDLRVENKKEIEFCLTSKKTGDYYGALIYSIENKPAAVGTWIHAKIRNNPGANQLTGAYLVPENQGKFSIFLYLPTFLLLMILLLLIVILKKKYREA